ncbi:MAG: hypothetical protein COU27_03475 [Candidatus Levybacteria bacterium CG10_big_fil_rev_8_21_14_0_10_36_7]|nr:MAG: hypothetical protein COU27_03475 [Candidatus Levybacteria bacterium CG10_big_fil_rev_8_21_14_0_10_36_7]
MKKNKTLLLAVIFATLLGGVFAQKNIEGTKKKMMAEQARFLNFEVQEINGVEVESPSFKSVFYQKKNETWRSTTEQNFPVNKDRLETILEGYVASTIINTVSTNTNNLKDFSLDKESRKKVVLKKNDEILASFFLGKSGQSSRSSYILREGENTVYLVEGISTFAIEGDLRDHTIIHADADTIDSLTIKNTNTEFSLEKKDNEWFLKNEDVKVINYEFLDKYLESLSKIDTMGIADQTLEFVPTKRSFSLTNEGAIFSLVVGQDADNENVFVKNHDGLIYVITKEQADDLFFDRNILFLKSGE